jgi:RNA polymerase sigma factor (sigma-70 family)
MPNAASRSRAMVAAVVLGTALSAGGSRSAAAELRERAGKTVELDGPPPEAVRDIGRYCQACWRNARLPADKWADCTQQVYVRLLERVAPQNWPQALADDGEDRREFLRAIDTVKKRAQRDRRFADLTPDVAEPTHNTISRDDREALWQAANVLTARQRRIVELTADGWATPDIADVLNTTPERVSDEKYKAVRKLRAELGVEA